jgi:hypothetical protein
MVGIVWVRGGMTWSKGVDLAGARSGGDHGWGMLNWTGSGGNKRQGDFEIGYREPFGGDRTDELNTHQFS